MNQWIFDPPPYSGAVTGGVTAQHVFEGDLNTFVREVLQNSGDQAVSEKAVDVRFALHELTGNYKEQFLEGLHWTNLKAHLDGVVVEGGPFGRRIRDALAHIETEPLRLLRIDDWNTRGLIGGEDDRHQNFAALCRHVLVSSEERGERGGSYGLGKAVLGNFSSISTVLYSSTLSGDEDGAFRFIGKTDLPYHEVEESPFRGPGWFGAREQRGDGERAVSLWNGAAVEAARKVNLTREEAWGSGTSITIVAFAEPEVEDHRDLKVIARDLSDSAARWFWPALCVPPASMRASVEIYRNEERTYQATVEATPEIRPYVDVVLSDTPGPHASTAGEVGEEHIEVTVPERVEPPEHEKFTTDTILRVGRRAEDMNGDALRNRVAVYRGARMVVDYVKPGRRPLDDKPFFGVLAVGLAAGESDLYRRAERFFRAAEPPAHNEWKLTKSLRVDYKRGSGAELKRLWGDVESSLIRLCGTSTPPGTEGPEALRRLFPIGGAGGGTVEPASFQASGLEAALEDRTWRFSGKVTRHGAEGLPWSFRLALWLEGESGRGTSIDLAELKTDCPTEVRDTKNGRRIVVDGEHDAVAFTGVSQVIDELVPERTRLRVEIRGRREA